MIYCPTNKDYKQLMRLLMPIPPKLLELLSYRGLGIWVLRGDLESSKFLYTKLGRDIQVWPPDNRFPHEAPHYHIFSKQITLSKAHLYTKSYNVVLHELGHAVDFLFNSYDQLSRTPFVRDKLLCTPHLNEYTKTMDSGRNDLSEHFATCFSAYFTEPIGEKKWGHHSINELHPKTIRYFQEDILDSLE